MVCVRRLVIVFVAVCAGWAGATARADTLVGWSESGMHALDADYSVFCLQPPYNTVRAQLISSAGLLVTNLAGLAVSYEAVADPDGSINRSSVGKTDFWDFVQPLFGIALAPDVGLPWPGPASFRMPGASNARQAMAFDATNHWFAASGIPITPFDDALATNAYPLLRLVARRQGVVVASTDIVAPVSDELECRACHASGSGPGAEPAAGWVNHPDPERDSRLNILRLHDEHQAASPVYTNALAVLGYRPDGLYATVVSNGTPVLCVACHHSESLGDSGRSEISPLTRAIHAAHAQAVDPSTQLPLDADPTRAACYRCHPGAATRSLRGVMGAAVAAAGGPAIECQSCHGSVSAVGAATRQGWLDLPNCQACHTGDAVTNNGSLRFTSALEANGQLRVATNQLFATNPDTPASGLSLYRDSRGHGGLFCAACHGSAHAEYPSAQRNDNLQSLQRQGHVGVLAECTACHGAASLNGGGGPHGLHPLGQDWITQHVAYTKTNGTAQCRACHGPDDRGTVLSRSQADRVVDAFGMKTFWRGFQIGCYTCHEGPASKRASKNRPPVATDVFAGAVTNTPAAVPLRAIDPDGDSLTLRIVSQPSHGTVGLAGTTATYHPAAGYGGQDSFTFAASDGSTDSNLGTATITVSPSGCGYGLLPRTASFDAFGGNGMLAVSADGGCSWAATSSVAWVIITNTPAGTGNGAIYYFVERNTTAVARTGAISVGGLDLAISQEASGYDAGAIWSYAARTCQTGKQAARCTIETAIQVRNLGLVDTPTLPLILYLSADNQLDAGDTVLKRYKIPRMYPGKIVIKELRLKLPAGQTASSQYLIVQIDGDQLVPDVNTANNLSLWLLPP